jgi:hypothetical protein
MPTEIITKVDLEFIRIQPLNDIRQLQGLSVVQKPTKEWLKSAEVRKLLNISAGTLRNLRINGKLSLLKSVGYIFTVTGILKNYFNNSHILP